jgi:hypothetical protein
MHAGIDYGKLGAEVEEWREGYLENIRETCGEEYAEEAASDLDANPWLALRWYLEDNTPEDPEVAAKREAYFTELDTAYPEPIRI